MLRAAMLLIPIGSTAAAVEPEQAATEEAPLTIAAIEAASYDGGALPDGRSAITVKVQVLLDRAGISPGIIDGYKGGMSESAIRAFEAREDLEVDGVMDPAVWEALGGPAAEGITGSYRIAPSDFKDIVAPLPTDYAELAEREALGYTRVSEKIAEAFHMDEDFLRALNPDVRFGSGDAVGVVWPGRDLKARVARVEIDKKSQRLLALNDAGAVVANYPVTVGSDETPSPSGEVKVMGIALMPTYTYDPDVNFQQGDNTEVLELPPGPNGPVGSVWIDLSKPTYGIHGTPEPASLFSAQSHGCVRMTNWDARELAGMIAEGATVVFLE